MSFETLKEEAAALTPAERKKLIGFLLGLNVAQEERLSMARKIDDRDPTHWLTLEQVDERLNSLGSVE